MRLGARHHICYFDFLGSARPESFRLEKTAHHTAYGNYFYFLVRLLKRALGCNLE